MNDIDAWRAEVLAKLTDSEKQKVSQHLKARDGETDDATNAMFDQMRVDLRELILRLKPSNVIALSDKLCKLFQSKEQSVQVPPIVCLLAVHGILTVVAELVEEEDKDNAL